MSSFPHQTSTLRLKKSGGDWRLSANLVANIFLRFSLRRFTGDGSKGLWHLLAELYQQAKPAEAVVRLIKTHLPGKVGSGQVVGSSEGTRHRGKRECGEYASESRTPAYVVRRGIRQVLVGDGT